MLQELMPIYSKDGTCQTIKEYVERHDDAEIDGIKQDIEDLKVDKVDKVENAVEGDVAGLTASGNIFDTGISLYGEKTYDYAPVLNIKNAVPIPAVDCKVKVKPIQDLHGYDHPWPAGGGKNKLPLVLADIKANNTSVTGASWSGNVCTLRDVTITVLTDTDGNITGFKFNGTVNGNGTFYLNNVLGLASGDYILSGGHTNPKRIYFYNGTSWYDDNGSGKNFTISGTEASQQVGIVLTNGETYNNEIFYPMIRLATESDATFAPYSNICPISGIDEVEIEVSDGESEPTTTTIPLPSTMYDGDVDVTSGDADENNGFVEFDGSDDEGWQIASDATAWFYTNLNNVPFSSSVSAVMSNLFKSDFSDSPWNIDDNAWIRYGQLHVRPDSIIAPSGQTAEGLAEFKAWLAQNPLEVCYELATPTTISFTPADVELIEGTNVVSANTGDISMTVKYDRLADLEDRVTALENA